MTIQRSESYLNHTSGSYDGDGFDLDGGVTNSVVQYNYSHDNDGAGFLMWQYVGATMWGGNVIRYNISQNDGRKLSYGAIQAGASSGTLGGADIYGNTIFLSPSPNGAAPSAILLSTPTTGFHFRNNLIITPGGVSLLSASGGDTDLLFQGNDYWTNGVFTIKFGGTSYGSLAAWQAITGQELTGKNVDPMLRHPGGGGTFGDATLLPTLDAYTVLPGSPMVNAGVDLTMLGIDAGTRDYFGNLDL